MNMMFSTLVAVVIFVVLPSAPNSVASADTFIEESQLPDYCFEPESEPEEGGRRKRSCSAGEATCRPDEPIEQQDNKTEFDYSRFSDKFQNCVQVMIEVGCYQVLSNGSVYLPLYDMVLNQSDFIIINDQLYICPIQVEDKFSMAFGITSKVGIGISIVCIIMHMVMFLWVPAMRNLPGYCLFSLCVALLIAYLCYFVRDFIAQSVACSDVGMLMFYFFLASFFWMNVLAYDVWRSLRLATAKLRLVTRVWFRFGMYSLYAWGLSLMVVVIAMIIDSMADVPHNYKLKFSVRTCWFSYKHALLVYFAFPLFFLLFLNLVFFVWSLLMIASASMKNADNRNVLRTRLCIFLRLFIIMGLTWIFGVVGAATNVMAFWYLFVLFASSQGVLIFFSFTFGEKVKRALSKRVHGRKISGTPTQSSFHSTPHSTTAV